MYCQQLESIFISILCILCAVLADLGLEFLTEPTSVMPPPGSGRAVFRCIASPLAADIRWLLKGQTISEDPARWKQSSRHKLTVRLPKRNDDDRGLKVPASHSFDYSLFQCVAHYKGRALVSHPAKLIIADLEPFPYQENIHIDITVGNVAVIPCTPPYSVPAAVTEFDFQGVKIDKSRDNYKLMPSGDLQIMDVQISDSGSYQCIAYNPFLEERKQANHKIFLTVMEPTSPSAPKLITSPNSRTSVVMGSNVTIECAAVSHPPPNVTWYKEDGQLPRLRHLQAGGNLLLFGVRRGDEGTYYCQANNGVGNPVSSSTVLEVQEIPQITKGPQNEQVMEGEDVALNCVTKGHPKPVVTWIHNGNRLFPDAHVNIRENKLILHKVTKKRAGIYQCFASNELETTYAASLLSINSDNSSLSENDYDKEDDYEYDIEDEDTLTTFQDMSPSDEELDNHELQGGTLSDISDDKEKKKKKNKKKNKGVKMVPPSRPEITRLSDTSVMVRWGVPQNDGLPILFFKVQYREVGRKGSQWMTIDEDIAAHIHSYAVLDLKTGGKYRFRIAAVYSNNDNKLGPNSAKFILHKDPPMKKPVLGPAIIHAEAESPSAITLQWEYDDIDSVPIEGFFIYYRTTHSAGDYVKVTVLGANTRSHTISHLLPDTSYDIKMQCFNIAGTSNFSNIYTCKTMPSEEIVGIRRSSRPLQVDSNIVGSSSPGNVSSRNTDGGKVMYIAVGIVLGIMFLVITVFGALYIYRQKQQRQHRRERHMMLEVQIKPGTNGHVSTGNGFIPRRDKVNISVNPMSQLESDDHDKNDQFEDVLSNNNEVIRLQTLETNSNNQEEAEVFLGEHPPDANLRIPTEQENEELNPMLSTDEAVTNTQTPRSV